MPDLSMARTRGRDGAVLILVSTITILIPSIGLLMSLVLSIIGTVFIILAAKIIADVSSRDDIFVKVLLGYTLYLIADIVCSSALYSSIGSLLPVIYNPQSSDKHLRYFFEEIASSLGILIMALIMAIILYIVGAIFVYLGYSGISEVSDLELFRTVGVMHLVGAILLPILGIGALILFIAFILEVIAWSLLPSRSPLTPYTVL